MLIHNLKLIHNFILFIRTYSSYHLFFIVLLFNFSSSKLVFVGFILNSKKKFKKEMVKDDAMIEIIKRTPCIELKQ